MSRKPNPEREALRRKGMIGFAVLPWDGHLYRALRTATIAAAAPTDVALVRTDGALYRQSDGQPIAPLLDDAVPPRHCRIDLSRRCRARRAISVATRHPPS